MRVTSIASPALDELDEVVLEDHLARRDRNGFSRLEGIRRAHPHVQPAGLRVQVTEKVPDSLDRAPSVRHEGGPYRVGVGREEVRRSEGVRHLPGGELESARRGLVEACNPGRQRDAGACVDEMDLLQHVEPGHLVPGAVPKAAIVVVGACNRLRFDAGHAHGAVSPERTPRLGELGPHVDQRRRIECETRPELPRGIVQAKGVERGIGSGGAVARCRQGSVFRLDALATPRRGSRKARRAIHDPSPRSRGSCGILGCVRNGPDPRYGRFVQRTI